MHFTFLSSVPKFGVIFYYFVWSFFLCTFGSPVYLLHTSLHLKSLLFWSHAFEWEISEDASEYVKGLTYSFKIKLLDYANMETINVVTRDSYHVFIRQIPTLYIDVQVAISSSRETLKCIVTKQVYLVKSVNHVYVITCVQ